ncbi:MAG: ABC transporter ATP-binding protein [Clostridiales bacterium]|nr:ABC transporter ATP-binding protein [Clostridiales bacterium]
MKAIEVVDLYKNYGDVEALRGLTFCVEQGELVTLLGVNGAGKSTTLKVLCGLVKPDGGRAEIYGYDVWKQRQKLKGIFAICPQETAIAPMLTVRENLEFICAVYGMEKEESGRAILEITRELGLCGVIGRRAGKLSGGYQRRLSIAMALITKPKVLYLDEPTLGLDVLSRRELWEIIEGLKGKVTVILTTHYMEEAEALSTRVAVMDAGHLVFCGTPCEMKEAAGCEGFEEAFVRLVRGEVQ